MKGNVSVKVEVPANVDRLIKELSKLDGSDVAEFYQYLFLDGLRSFFDAGDLLNLEGLAKIHGLHEAFNSLDTSMYGKGGETRDE